MMMKFPGQFSSCRPTACDISAQGNALGIYSPMDKLQHLVSNTRNLFPSRVTTLVNSCRPTACNNPAQGNALGFVAHS